MKIRLGFVSNSSSASYTISIGINKNDFYRGLLSDKSAYTFFSVSSFINELEECIKVIKEGIKEDKLNIKLGKDRGLMNFCLDSNQNYLKTLKATLVRVKKIKNPERDKRIIKEILAYHHIRLNDSLEGSVVLQYHTTMHNSYVEALPDDLKEIILYFMFEHSAKMKMNVDHGGN